MTGSDVRIGDNNRKPKIEDAIALCEGGFAYEGAMVVATLNQMRTDIVEQNANRQIFLAFQGWSGRS